MSHGAKKKILIADDDEAVADSTKLILELKGYEVETIYFGDIQGKVKEVRPDIVMLDVWLRGQHGGEVCKKLKVDTETQSVPVLLVSASQNLEDLSVECSSDGYLQKPFTMEQLLSAINRVCEKCKRNAGRMKVAGRNSSHLASKR